MTRLFAFLFASLLLLPFCPNQAEAKAITSTPQVHVVKQGDTLYEIAQKHGLTVKELKRLNGLNSSRLKIGQKLALVRAAAPPLPQAAKTALRNVKVTSPGQSGNQSVHVVKKGDSLYTIARRHGMSVTQLQQLNGLSSNRLQIGQRLLLAGPSDGDMLAERPATPEPPRKFAAVEQHVVKKGDTLSSIARRHHLTVNELKRLNGLTSTRLQIGQRLALNDPYQDRNPLLLPGDASEDEVLEMAYTASSELELAAFNYLSTPYRFGGNSRKGIDCSAFVQRVFHEVDVDLPRSAREQFRFGDKVEREELQKGDLIFFRTYAKYPSHVGIYLGDGKMIHASSRSRRVVVTSIDLPYYQKRFIGAKRISLLDHESTATVDGQDALLEEPDDLAAPVETAALDVTAAPPNFAPQAADEPMAAASPEGPTPTTAPDAVSVVDPSADTEPVRAPVVTGKTLN